MLLQTQHDAPVESKSCKLLEPFRLTVSREFKEILEKKVSFFVRFSAVFSKIRKSISILSTQFQIAFPLFPISISRDRLPFCP